jgi:hypothetical protein
MKSERKETRSIIEKRQRCENQCMHGGMSMRVGEREELSHRRQK